MLGYMGRKKKNTPKGRRRGSLPPPLKKTELIVPEVDSELVKRYLDLNFARSIAELEAIEKDKSVSFGEASVVRVMLRIYRSGDIYALNALYDRLIGPILRKISITGERPFEQWSMAELFAEKLRLDKENRFTMDMIEKEKRLIAAVHSGNYDRDKRCIIEVTPRTETSEKVGTG